MNLRSTHNEHTEDRKCVCKNRGDCIAILTEKNTTF